MSRTILSVLVMTILLCSCAPATDPENTLFLDLEAGRIVIALRPDLAPQHVKRIKELTRAGFYDGLAFHRVVEGFMAQTGDPTGTGAGGTGITLKAELSDVPFGRGSVGMARSVKLDSADSQFFICVDRARGLDGRYTFIGRVIEGMDIVDLIKKGTWERNNLVEDPDILIRMQVASDVNSEEKV